MQPADIQKRIDSMTLEQKIGQMFMGNICGGESLDLAKRNLERFAFGALQFSGVFERFVRGGDYLPCGVSANRPYEEVAEFLAGIKQAALDILGVPVIIGGDQEGGLSGDTFRRRNITAIPLQMGLGASGSPGDTYEAATISAHEVKAVGLDMLYGPALDVNTNPRNPEIGTRSFGDDPEMVAVMGEQVIKAYRAEGIISTAKHFPGRGRGKMNAHAELETIDVSRALLDEVELVPFRQAVAAGVDSIMVCHTVYPALERERLPASLSPAIIRGLLREELGFDGVIIPDALTMFAISKNYDVPRACAMCLEAGADMVFMKVQDLYQPSIQAIKDSVRSGRLPEDEINRSVGRILLLKQKHGLFAGPRLSREHLAATIGCAKHTEAMRRIAGNAALALKNEAALMPLSPDRYHSILAVVPRDWNIILANDPILDHEILARALRRRFQEVRNVLVDEHPTEAQAYEAIGRAKNAELIVVGIYSAGLSPELLALLDKISALGKPVVAVLAAAPYEVLRLPHRVRAVVCSFGMGPYSLEAVVNLMTGNLKGKARLPVEISPDMPRGFAPEITEGS